MDKACLDFGIMENGTGTIWVGRDSEFPDTIVILLHRVRNPVPVV